MQTFTVTEWDWLLSARKKTAELEILYMSTNEQRQSRINDSGANIWKLFQRTEKEYYIWLSEISKGLNNML